MFDTPPFWAALLLVAAFFFSLPGERVRLRAVVLSLVSPLVLHYVVGLSGWLLLLLFAAMGWVVAGLLLTRRLAEKHPLAALLAVLSPILLCWVLGKEAFVHHWARLRLFYFAGFSYFFIKAWTLIKDAQDKRLKDPLDPWVVFAYFLYFPTYVSGPMHLYNEFAEGLKAPAFPDGEGLLDVAFRVALGLVKVKVIAPLFTPLSLISLQGRLHPRPLPLLLASCAYSVVIFSDFSGYSDLAVATSRLLGQRTPENFNRPYLAANVRDFWQRWHISFSRILTSYIFIPISRALQREMPARRTAIMVIGYLATFLFCGYWHGPTLNFLLWGLYHGVGLIAYDLYRPWALRRRKQRGAGPPGPMGRALATAATFVFVSLGWIFFVGG